MKKKIVVIQDDIDILNIMDDVLTGEGFAVTSSLTTEPIQTIEEIDPDLLIVDDHLPGPITGSELIFQMKSDPDTENMSAVLTSTSNNLAQLSTECKADDYIEKPFDIDKLVQVVKDNS